MTTDSLNVDLQPTYCRVDIKGKITQIRFDEEILTERSTVQRSTTTGWLCITMPKADYDELRAQIRRNKEDREMMKHRAKMRALEIEEEEARERRIAELQLRARKDAEEDDKIFTGAAKQNADEEEVKRIEPKAEPYCPPSDPSFLI